MHVRRQIREAAATALTGLATTGSRVYQSRMRPATDDKVPCLLITTDAEEIRGGVQAVDERALTLTIRGIAKGSSGLDDTLDDMAAEVETALAGASTLGGLVPGGLALRGIDVDFDDTLDKPVGVIVLQYQAGYFTRTGAPGAVI